MNGVHDMGGMHGFGPVEHEKNEPVFHARLGRPRSTRMTRAHESWRGQIESRRVASCD